MTERGNKERRNALRSLFVNTAASYLGTASHSAAHRELLARYNAIRPLPRGYAMQEKDPWCAAFVSAVAQQCGLCGRVFPECSCPRMLALYEQAGRFREEDDYLPAPGDLLFYHWQDPGSGDDRGSPDHVGIVTACEGGRIRLIEGNVSDAVARREIGVNSRYIRGFALPDFAGEGPLKGESSPAFAPAPTCSLTLPLLRLGASGESVKALQLLLQGRGESCGRHGADGDFGSATAAALLRYQEKAGLTVDGVAGPATWKHILTGGKEI